MREIKFRAWDGERLRKVNTIGWVDEGVDFVTTPRYSGPAEDFILMQYAGLKDKSGVEIYEGDVVQYFRNELAVIVFQNGGVDIRGLSSMEREPLQSRMGFMKVLGNIYENPELLEREAE